MWASLVAQRVKRLPAMQEIWVRSLCQEDPWRRKWQPTPVFLPGESHGQRSLVDYSLCNGGAEVSKAPVRSHTLLQPAPPGAVRPLFLCRRLACLAFCELRFPVWTKSSSWRCFLRGFFLGAGANIGNPTHRGRQNHIQHLCSGGQLW